MTLRRLDDRVCANVGDVTVNVVDVEIVVIIIVVVDAVTVVDHGVNVIVDGVNVFCVVVAVSVASKNKYLGELGSSRKSNFLLFSEEFQKCCIP